MTGISDLNYLLRNMNPVLSDEEFVFVSTKINLPEIVQLNPLYCYVEDEGLTIILRREIADKNSFSYDNVYKRITLNVHSSLDAVGFLSSILTKLASAGISVNAVSACYHDHLFINADDAPKALELLLTFLKQ